MEIAKVPSTAPDDKGWDNNVGDAAYGNERVKEEYKRLDQKIPCKERNQDGVWMSTKENIRLPEIAGKEYHSTKEKLKFKDTFVAVIEKGIGEPTKSITIMVPNDTPLSYNADAKCLVDHLVDRVEGDKKPYSDFFRSRFISTICITITDPAEIRIGFVRSATGKIAIRSGFFNLFKDRDGKSQLVKVVFDSNCASFVSHTALTTTSGKIPVEEVKIYRKGLK